MACRLEGFPTRYLGIPLSVRKLKRSDEQALVDKVAARIPGWKGNLLNAAGRTALVKATLSAIPVHTMIGLGLSRWAVKSIDRLRRAFIWAGSDEVGGGRCKIAWANVCRPKELGGLGISDLTRVGVALRVRWVWRDRRRGIASVADEHPVRALFSAATVISLGNGESTLFWTDRWLNGSSVQDLAPTLYNAVRPRKKRATVAESLPGSAWARHIAGPISLQLLVELDHLCDRLQQVQLQQRPDTFQWNLTADREYSAASAYGAMFFGSTPILGAKIIWKTAAPPKVRFFFWLAIHGRCWTADRRFRHGLQQSNTCIICDQAPETLDHLLRGCCFARQAWHIWVTRLHLCVRAPTEEGPAFEWWLSSRKLIPKALRQGFDSFFMLLGWLLWKERNARTFDGVAMNVVQLTDVVEAVASQWCLAGNSRLRLFLASS